MFRKGIIFLQPICYTKRTQFLKRRFQILKRNSPTKRIFSVLVIKENMNSRLAKWLANHKHKWEENTSIVLAQTMFQQLMTERDIKYQRYLEDTLLNFWWKGSQEVLCWRGCLRVLTATLAQSQEDLTRKATEKMMRERIGAREREEGLSGGGCALTFGEW